MSGGTCARIAGNVFCWGRNDTGQLGDGSTMNRPFPVQAQVSNVVDIVAGAFFTCARIGDALRCWGKNDSGQLGDGSTMNRPSPVQVLASTQPSTALNGVTQLMVGAAHVCTRRGSQVECWGNNENGQLGDGQMGAATDRALPGDVQLAGGVMLANAIDVGSGSSAIATCARLDTGENVCWGLNMTTAMSAPLSCE